MHLLLESARESASQNLDEFGRVGGRSLDEWTLAYSKVEKYFSALRIRNKVFLGQLVLDVLKSAMRRAPHEPETSTTELAVCEMDRRIMDWYGQILPDLNLGEDTLCIRGRLALLLADMPGKWQDQFLRPGPWPAEFVAAMRETYLRSGPDFQRRKMAPRALDLGPVATLAEFSGTRVFKIAAFSVWVGFTVFLIWVFVSNI